jgi:hypothetical protein
MIKLVTHITTPYEVFQHIEPRCKREPTKSLSSMMDTRRNAHSAAGITVGCFRYSRSSVRAAFFFTKVGEILEERSSMLETRTVNGIAHGDIKSLCTSSDNASAISLLPTFAIACKARQLLTSLFSSKSFRIEFTTSRRKSEFSCISRVTAR